MKLWRQSYLGYYMLAVVCLVLCLVALLLAGQSDEHIIRITVGVAAGYIAGSAVTWVVRG